MKYQIFYIFILTLFFFGCKQSDQMMPKAVDTATKIIEVKPGMIHTVYFWLNDEVDAEQRKSFEQALVKLSTITSIQKMYWGTAADTEERGVIDSSYDYAINLLFDSLADEAAYQIDPIHEEFKTQFGPIFKKVIVYDNLVN